VAEQPESSASLGPILVGVASLEGQLTRRVDEVRALRQQVDELLAFARLQHDIVRDLLEELRPVLVARTAETAPEP
jgi:hypothetical protein